MPAKSEERADRLHGIEREEFSSERYLERIKITTRRWGQMTGNNAAWRMPGVVAPLAGNYRFQMRTHCELDEFYPEQRIPRDRACRALLSLAWF